jgi:hypothetical protein
MIVADIAGFAIEQACDEVLAILQLIPDAREKKASVKPNVERHRQITVGASVHPWPINEITRKKSRSRK